MPARVACRTSRVAPIAGVTDADAVVGRGLVAGRPPGVGFTTPAAAATLVPPLRDTDCPHRLHISTAAALAAASIASAVAEQVTFTCIPV